MRSPVSQKIRIERWGTALGDHCAQCGKNLTLVGRTHRCVPNSPTTVPNTVPNKLKTGDAQRVAKFANKEKDRAYHKELMRKRRAAGK